MPFEEEYFQKFVRFIKDSTQAGTLQFVFLKSLFYLAGYKNLKPNIKWGLSRRWIREDEESLKVDFNFIAVLYIKYYWDMFYKFRLKQATPNNEYAEDVNIHKNFKDESGEPIQPPKKTADLAGDDYSPLRENVIYGNPSRHIRSSFNEVLFALDRYGFFKARNPSARSTPIPRTDTFLEFDLEVPNFFQKYAYESILDHAINYMLTKHLEKINKFIPQIAKKVIIDIPRSGLSGKEKEEYDRRYKSSETFKCFYCFNSFRVTRGGQEMTKNKYINPAGRESYWSGPIMDHVIPFDFVLSDDLYNAVPSCFRCNTVLKSNHLPDEDILNKVIKRNETLTQKSRRDYSEAEFRKLWNNCKDSYNGNREMFHFQNRSEV